MKFNKSTYQEANGFGNQFTKVEDGEYVAKVEKFTLEKADAPSLSQQIVVIWRIDPTSDDFANCTVRWSQTVQNKNGEENTIGLDMLANLLKTFTEDQFNFEEFHFDDSGHIINFNEVAAQFAGTQAKIKVTGTESGQYTNYKVFVNDIYHMSYKPDPENTTIAQEYVEALVEGNREGTVEAQIGQLVVFQVAPNKPQQVGKIVVFSEETGTLMIEAERDGSMQTVPADLVQIPNEGEVEALRLSQKASSALTGGSPEPVSSGVLEEEPLLEEEPPKVQLKVGSEVTAPWNGSSFQGKIHKIDEDAGTAQIAYRNNEGKLVGRTVQLGDCVPF